MEDAEIDILTFSETWLKPYLKTQVVQLTGYKPFRLNRKAGNGPKGRKRGGGLITYVHDKHAPNSEQLDDLNISNEHFEVQWIYIHRPHCKDICICNKYRPPKGNLVKAIKYLAECIKTFNISKTDLFLLGYLNVNYKNKRSADYKQFNFFARSNGLTQHITKTTRNTDKTTSLIDLALSNSKFIQSAGTLDHFISDHQPIFLLHKKARDRRPKAKFMGRTYRNFDREVFKNKLRKFDWSGFYDLRETNEAWNFVYNKIVAVLDTMWPIGSFHIKNYRPDWMTDDLIELIKDRDRRLNNLGMLTFGI